MSIVPYAGMVDAALKLKLSVDSLWLAIARSIAWPNETAPPSEDLSTAILQDTIAYKKVDMTSLAVPDPNGDIEFQSNKYRLVADVDAIQELARWCYIKASINHTESNVSGPIIGNVHWRVTGIFSGLVPASGFGSESVLSPAQVDDPGRLIFYANHVEREHQTSLIDLIEVILTTIPPIDCPEGTTSTTTTSCAQACQLSCQNSCEVGANCQTACQLGTACQSTCQATCQAGCQTTSCQTSCQAGACQDACQTGASCQNACQTGANCQVQCQSGCQNCQGAQCQTCQTSCQLNCENCQGVQCQTCQTTCQTGASCQQTCQVTCQTACQTGASCQTGCQLVSCETACQVSVCQTACELACQNCQTGCQACQTTCEVTCQITCQSVCQTGCQVTCQNCQTGCQIGCQSSCQISCQNCQGACQTECEISDQTVTNAATIYSTAVNSYAVPLTGVFEPFGDQLRNIIDTHWVMYGPAEGPTNLNTVNVNLPSGWMANSAVANWTSPWNPSAPSEIVAHTRSSGSYRWRTEVFFHNPFLTGQVVIKWTASGNANSKIQLNGVDVPSSAAGANPGVFSADITILASSFVGGSNQLDFFFDHPGGEIGCRVEFTSTLSSHT